MEALGPDELHPRVLKELATELGPIFAHLFQQSIDSGDIPKEWTLANISLAEPSKFGATLNSGYFRFLSISHSGEALE